MAHRDPDFAVAWSLVPGTGWLTEEEGWLLWKAVRRSTGPVLEVGCFHGRSTVLLHLACPDRPLYCVDPFEGFDLEGDPTGQNAKAQWLHNVPLLTGTRPVVVPAAFNGLNSVPDPSEKITLWTQRIEDWRPRPVGFAYLDGDHTYQGTLAQFEAALLSEAKVIACHDVGDTDGGQVVRNAAHKVVGPWDEKVDKMAVWYSPRRNPR